MFSYRHAFHAGNHADVLKHFVLVQLLQYMNQKDTAYSYIDTHAGAGLYQLDSNFASKNAEYETGIGPLWERTDLPPALAEYVDLIKAMNPSGKMRYYPGSPYCANQVAREQDRLRLFELHPADSKILTDNFRKLDEHLAAQGIRPTVRGKRVLVTRGDGFHELKGLLPPPSRRGVVLCDPPYEDKQDYRKVVEMLNDSVKRFPQGTYAIWYPILLRIEARNFAERMKHIKGTEWLNVTLTIRTPGPDGFGGLHSSGMFIINPPYTLLATLQEVMPYLQEVLGEDAGAKFVLESGSADTTPRANTLQQGENTPRGGAGRAPVSPRAIGPGGSLRGPNAPANAPRGSLRTSSRPGTPGAATGRPGSPGASYSRPAAAPRAASARPGTPRNTKPRRP